jgi:hypothetical protein
LVISSVLVGAAISQFVYEKIKVYFWGERNGGGRKMAVTKYYNEEHTKKPDGYFEDYERTEVFFISTNGKPIYYLVDISKFEYAKVPIEEDSNCIGAFY